MGHSLGNQYIALLKLLTGLETKSETKIIESAIPVKAIADFVKARGLDVGPSVEETH